MTDTPRACIDMRYIDMRLSELEKRINERFASFELAINKAESSLSDRLSSMNEFRATLADQTKNFITRPEHDKLDAAIQALRVEKATMDGKIAMFAVAVSMIVSFIMSGLLLVLNHFWPDVPTGK